MDFIGWYKKITESARQEPPAAVWENVQNQLDIEAVWNNLEKELPVSRTREKTFFVLAMAASLLVLIGVGFLFLAGPARPDAVQLAGDKQGQDIFQETPGSVERTFQSLLSSPAEFPTSADRNPGISPDSIPNAGRPQTPAWFPSALEDPNIVGAGQDKDLPFTVIAATGPLPAFQSSGQGTRKPAPPGYYAGITGHLANTWLLNNKTMQGLKSDDLTTSLPSFGYSIGIIAGRPVGRNLDIQAEACITSLRQGYNEYLHGQYVNNLMQLSYSSIVFSAKWYFINNTGHNKHSLLLGAYTGLLKNAIQDLDGISYSLTSQYRTTDYGIVAGYEYLHPLGTRFSLGTGFQAKLGLNNIFAGNEMIPGYLNNTRNGSINFMVTLRYDRK
jgi:hypothetical protein